jgi:hypothetical protein
MTRREFIEYAVKTVAAVAAGAWVLAERAAVRVFVRAEKAQKYPGRVKFLSGVDTQGKWSG